jgi:hypothetical protein
VTVSNIISAAAIPVTDTETTSSCQGGCFEVTVTGVPAGGQVEILLPKRTSGYQTGAVFRHFVNSTQTWKAHDAPDGVQTAPEDATTGLCPGLASSEWRTPTSGDTCTKYTLTDNGSNDDDLAPGSIVDPVGFGQSQVGPVNQNSTFSKGGCTLGGNKQADLRNSGHWLLVGAFMTFLRLFRNKSTKSAS